MPTIFIRAVTKRSLLPRRLLQQERRVTLRARLEHRHVPVDHVAVRILRTPVKYFAAFRLFDHQLALASRTRTRNADSLLLDVFTLGIIRTRNELAESSNTLHQLRAINWTFLVE